MKGLLRQVLVTIVIALLIFGVVRFTLGSFRVEGFSMEPSFHSGQYLLVDKVSYHFHPPHRGDVVVLWPPKPSNTPFIKRVIGLPGEEVRIKDGKVYIDDKLLEEPFSTRSISIRRWEIPDDYYFVMGDNRNNSSDSRHWGLVPRKNIIGKSWLCYWPPSEWGLSPSYPGAD